MSPQVANTADELVDYLLTAHHYAQRIVTSAIIAAYSLPAEAGGAAPIRPVLPDSLAEWAAFELSDSVFKVGG